MNFKYFTLAILLNFLCLNAFTQDISDLGRKSFSDIKAMYNIEPCEVTGTKVLSYCVEGGSRINYMFENNKLNGIMFLTSYLTRSQAERGLENEVSVFSDKNKIKPYFSNGSAYFYMENSPFNVSFSVIEFQGTPYLVYYTFLAKN
jgi:hypothetical protein